MLELRVGTSRDESGMNTDDRESLGIRRELAESVGITRGHSAIE
jgi:hypothetical protein